MDHDLIIIGGGAGGLGALRAALWSKADVLMINDGPPGGDCTFTGCVPSKTMLSAARNGASFGEAMARVGATIERIAATESADVLMEHGASFIKDRARLVTHDTVAVGERRITAPRIIVATGGRPSIPPIPGLATTPHHTNETIFSLVHQPRRLGVLVKGGGTKRSAEPLCRMQEKLAGTSAKQCIGGLDSFVGLQGRESHGGEVDLVELHLCLINSFVCSLVERAAKYFVITKHMSLDYVHQLKGKHIVYVLALQPGEDGKPRRYVGSTTNVERRMAEHLGVKSGGAAWCKKYKPTDVISCRVVDSKEEAAVMEVMLCSLHQAQM